jgi:O-antigen/teichoic acid export membrane protein
MVFKGILRIIHQAFFKEMIYDEWCLKIDKFSILIALLYSGSFVFFPKSFITFFFGKQYLSEESFFWFLAIASLVYSFVLSSATRALLDKMDTKYSVVCLIAASTAILSTMALSFFKPDALNIGISVLLGEIIFCVGLIKISKIKELFKTRVAFFISNSLLLIIPLFSRIFFHDILKYFILSVIIFGIALLSKNYKIFLD